MSDLNCPYCDAEITICHDDGFGYEEETLHEQYCSKCDKYFVFETYISFHYEAYPAECLNNKDHDWIAVNSAYDFKLKRCTMCGIEQIEEK